MYIELMFNTIRLSINGHTKQVDAVHQCAPWPVHQLTPTIPRNVLDVVVYQVLIVHLRKQYRNEEDAFF